MFSKKVPARKLCVKLFLHRPLELSSCKDLPSHLQHIQTTRFCSEHEGRFFQNDKSRSLCATIILSAKFREQHFAHGLRQFGVAQL